MADGQYDGFFIRGSKPGGTSDYDKRITAYIDDDIIKGSFYFSGMFMAPQYSTGIHSPHIHPYNEILFFHGIDPDNPTELGWEIDLFVGPEFERHHLTKTVIVYLPKNFVHNPIVTRMKKPVFHVFTMFGPLCVVNDYPELIKQEGAFERHYDKHFISGPKPGQTNADYKYTTYLDDEVFKGSPYFTSTFITNDNPIKEEAPHSSPYGKILGFFGVNSEDKLDLGAEVEFLIGENLEKHTFNQSTAVYIPAGLTHCMIKAKVNRPFIFVECADSAKPA